MAVFDESWLRRELKQAGVNITEVEALVQWANCARLRDPVLFVGAGLTRGAPPRAGWEARAPDPSRPPKALSWAELADRFRDGLEGVEPREGDPLWLAELYREHLGQHALFRLVRDAVPEEWLEPSPTHAALTGLDWHAVLTTNYDDLLRRAFQRYASERDLDIVCSDTDLARPPRRRRALEIIHLHGHFDLSQSLVVALEDYRRYPSTNPGLLAKVRQLMLQHPVLLLGFGATDPNFVEWSGWVEDVCGQLRPPHVSLMVRWGNDSGPSSARRSFWRNRLSFVTCPETATPRILEALRRYIWPRTLDSQDIETLATRELESLATSEAVAGWLEHQVAYQRRRWGDEHFGLRFRALSSQAVWRVLVLQHGDQRASVLRRALAMQDRDTLSRLVAAGAMPAVPEGAMGVEDRRGVIRQAFGEAWGRVVLASSKTFGRTFQLADVWFDGEAECAAVADDDRRRGIQRLLAWYALRETTLTGEAPAASAAREAFAAAWTLTEDEAATLADVATLRAVRTGTDLSVGAGDASPQALRRRGFLSALAGDRAEAWRAYRAASEASRAEGDDSETEWLTLTSAIIAGRGVREIPGVDEIGVAVRELDKRRSELQRQPETHADGPEQRLERARESQRKEAIKQFTESSTARPGARFLSDPAGGAGRLLDECEAIWVHPVWTSQPADLVGCALWSQGEYVQAVRVLSRYGCENLGKLVGHEVSNTGQARLPRGLFDELLRPGRYGSEWLARLEALERSVYELDVDQVESLGLWIEGCASFLKDGPDDVVRAGGTSAGILQWWRDLSVLAAIRWRYVGYPVFKAEWGRWRTRFDGTLFPAALGSTLDDLPWQRWMDDHSVTHAAAIEDLVAALQDMERWPHPLASPADVLALFIEWSSDDELRNLPLVREYLEHLQASGPELRMNRGHFARRHASAEDGRQRATAALGRLVPVRDRVGIGGEPEFELFHLIEHLTEDEQRQVLSHVSARHDRWQQAEARSTSGFGRDMERPIYYRKCGLLCGALAGRGAAPLRPEAALLWLRFASEHVEALCGLPELPPLVATSPAVTAVTSGWLSGWRESADDRDVARVNALEAVNALLRRQEGVRVPPSWLLTIEVAVGSDNARIARMALGVLGSVADRTPTLGQDEILWQGWTDAVALVSGHPRALVRGAQAWALTVALKTNPPAGVAQRLAELRPL